MTRIKLFFVFLILLIADQSTKYIIRTSGGFYICNTGLAFGIQSYWIIAILLAVIFLLTFFLKKQDARNKNQTNSKFQISINKNSFWDLKNWLLDVVCTLFLGHWLLRTGILLILSGAISNLIDRAYFGCVTYLIDLRIWPVFNFADIYITIGAIALLMEISKIKNKNDNEKFKNERIIK